MTSHDLWVVDVSVLEDPIVVGSLGTSSSFRDIASFGEYLFALSPDGISIIDISEPAGPREVGNFDNPGYGIAIDGDQAYVVGDKLFALDISNPLFPIEIGSFSLEVTARNITVSRTHAYVADGIGGLGIFSLCTGSIFLDGFESGDTSAWVSQ